MALDKLVDSTQLNTDLTAVANAIRTKGGTSAQLAFPAGFVDAVEAIETGGGTTVNEFLSMYTRKELTGDIVLEQSVRQLKSSLFAGQNVKSVRGEGVIVVTNCGYAFDNCPELETISFPNLQSLYCAYFIMNCPKLKLLCFPNLGVTGTTKYMYSSTITNCANLEVIDLSKIESISGSNNFLRCASLTTVIFRRTDAPVNLGNVNNFTGTPFAPGGSGGTIYIPQALYDHLGDGTALDYKAATNWSTLDGYGTITWAKIEGSIYETQYADGTPIAA